MDVDGTPPGAFEDPRPDGTDGVAGDGPITVVVRVWLPDRPGALGAVASRIGAVQGDVAGIEILERGAGRAVDDIVVDLPHAGVVDLLVREINEVDGVDVEELRVVADGRVDPWLDAVEAAAQLVGAASDDELLDSLCDRAFRTAGSAWAVVVELDGGRTVAVRGTSPSAAWLSAFVEGSQASARLGSARWEQGDVTWVPLPSTGLALILGREGTAFRAKERRQVAALARIADAWLCSMRQRSQMAGRLAHPSRGAAAVTGHLAHHLAQSRERSTARFHRP